jgi:hypothetical protein
MKHPKTRYPISKRRHFWLAALLLGLAMSLAACEDDEPPSGPPSDPKLNGPKSNDPKSNGPQLDGPQLDDTQLDDTQPVGCETPWSGSGSNPFLGKWGYTWRSFDYSSFILHRYWFYNDGTYQTTYHSSSSSLTQGGGCYKVIGNQVLFYNKGETPQIGISYSERFEFARSEYGYMTLNMTPDSSTTYTYIRCDDVEPLRC